jgi:cytochrome c peroxidase
MSSTNTMACASCHVQSLGFASDTRFSEGVTGELSARNAMALGQARYNWRNVYFADERVRTLETLALMPIRDTKELANTLANAIARMQETSFYPQLFAAAFGTPEITEDRISKAMAQFLRSLISYNSRFDQFRRNFDVSIRILTPQEEQGRMVAHNNSCSSGCHSTDVQIPEFPANNGLDAVVTDPGINGRGAFRSASLRNIAQTAPYMHDGRFATLREVIDHYDHGVKMSPFLSNGMHDGTNPQRLNLSESDKLALEAFLRTLTDEAFLSDPKFSDPFAF